MGSTMFVLFLSASIFVAVLSNRCHHGDISQCGLTCNDPNESLGCVHDVCTCVPKPHACLSVGDCTVLGPCEKHDEAYHCFDNECLCKKPAH